MGAQVAARWMEALRESTPDKTFKGLFRADIGAQGPRAAVDDVPALVRDDPKRLRRFPSGTPNIPSSPVGHLLEEPKRAKPFGRRAQAQ
jgi:hypothetical protein